MSVSRFGFLSNVNASQSNANVSQSGTIMLTAGNLSANYCVTMSFFKAMLSACQTEMATLPNSISVGKVEFYTLRGYLAGYQVTDQVYQYVSSQCFNYVWNVCDVMSEQSAQSITLAHANAYRVGGGSAFMPIAVPSGPSLPPFPVFSSSRGDAPTIQTQGVDPLSSMSSALPSVIDPVDNSQLQDGYNYTQFITAAAQAESLDEGSESVDREESWEQMQGEQSAYATTVVPGVGGHMSTLWESQSASVSPDWHFSTPSSSSSIN